MNLKPKYKIFLFIGIFILIWSFSFYFSEILIKFLIKKLTEEGFNIITVSPLESINLVFESSIYITIGIIAPLILLFFYEWISDALYKKEKQVIKQTLKWSVVSIVGGVIGLCITYFVIVPFLVNYSNRLGLNATTSLEPLVILFLANFAIMSIVFLIPLIIKILNRLNIIYKDHLKKGRKIFYFISLILLAIITPTTDIVSLFIIMLPLILVYEISILIVKKEDLSINDSNVYIT